MTIKGQFHLLMGGIVLLPLLAASGFGIFNRVTREENHLALPIYEEIAPLLPNNLAQSDWQALTKHIRRVRANTDIIILLRDLRVIFSSISDFKTGTFIDKDALLGLIQSAKRDHYILEAPMWREGRNFIILQRISPQNPPRPFIFERFFIALVGLMLVFVILMSVIILRSVMRSVLSLEKATARIANGEFDIAVEAKGSNEISSLVNSLNKMRLRLQEDEARRSRFIMGISHDLRTPLALIKGYTEAIEDGYAKNPEALYHYTGIITAKVEQLEGMVNGLIDFVRLGSGENILQITTVRLRAFLEHFVERISHDARLLNRTISAELELPEDCTVSFDEGLALRALENIINNALRYTADGGSIRIHASMTGTTPTQNHALIEISDDGPGIKPEDLNHVFDMFYRGSNSRREQGMGMGLAVVKSIADLQGWQVEALAVPKGACFRIVLC